MPMLARRHSRAVWTFPETLDSVGSATAIVLIVTWLSETNEKTKPQFIHGWGLFEKPVRDDCRNRAYHDSVVDTNIKAVFVVRLLIHCEPYLR